MNTDAESGPQITQEHIDRAFAAYSYIVEARNLLVQHEDIDVIDSFVSRLYDLVKCAKQEAGILADDLDTKFRMRARTRD